MKFLADFLTSGHQFSSDENLQKFRFSLLNSLMVMALFFTCLNFLASKFGAIDFGSVFETSTLVYIIVSIFVIFILRKNKSHYTNVVYFFIASSLALFYFVLLTRTEDEFRLIAFFLALFITYVLLGKKSGLALAVFLVISILVLNSNYDLKISEFALSTFTTFFIIFTAFLYFFINKVEKDAVEFLELNNRLKENVKAETELRKEQEMLFLRQCRMVNMGEMIDSIAHQWRQPLMHINSILLNMDGSLKSKEKNIEYLEGRIDEVTMLTTHMSQTIEDFRGLFKVEREMTEFLLQKVITDVLELMKNDLQGIKVNSEPKTETLILGHRSEFMQVIIILLGNAVEALESNSIEAKQISIGIVTTSDKVTLTIEDNAGGIDTSVVSSIFDPYFTTKEQSGGTGLGLYVAKIIIEDKMKGLLSVSNTLNGSNFQITLNKPQT